MRRSASSTCSYLAASWRLVAKDLPRHAGVIRDGLEAVGAGGEQLLDAGLSVRAPALGDDGTHAVAGHRAVDEQHVPLGRATPAPP